MKKSIRSFFLLIGIIILIVILNIPQAFAAQETDLSATIMTNNDTKNLFLDVSPDNANILYINYLANRGIIKGYPDGSYHPRAGLSRAEAAALLSRVAGLDVDENTTVFSDVKEDHWAAGVIGAAGAAGLLNGYPDGTFRPNSKLTRAEGIALFLRLSGQSDFGADLPALEDMKPDHWAARPAAVAISSGMIKLPEGQNKLNPHEPLTRSDLARLLGILITRDPSLYQTELKGQLKVTKGIIVVTRAEKNITLKVNDTYEIITGDKIKSLTNSTGELVFPDGSGILIKAGTEIYVKEAVGRSYAKPDGTPGTAVDWLALDMPKGEMFCALASSHSSGNQLEQIQTGNKIRPLYPLIASLEGEALNRIIAEQVAYQLPDQKKYQPNTQQNGQTMPWWQQTKAKRVRVQVDMPWSVAAVRGSYTYLSPHKVFSLLADVLVTSGGKTVNVTNGQYTETAEGKSATDPVGLSSEQKQQWIAPEVMNWVLERGKEIHEKLESEEPKSLPQVMDEFVQFLEKVGLVIQNEELNNAITEFKNEYQQAQQQGNIQGFMESVNQSYTQFTRDVKQISQSGSSSGSSSSGSGSNPVPVSSIVIKAELELEEGGQTLTLAPSVLPASASYKLLEWSSNDAGVATVDQNGSVTPVVAGKTVIRAVAKDGSGVLSNDCIVTVYKVIEKSLPENGGEVVLDNSDVPVKLKVLVGDIAVNVSMAYIPDEASLEFLQLNEELIPPADIPFVGLDITSDGFDFGTQFKVELPIPEGLDENTAGAFHYNSDTGSWEYREATIKDGQVSFYTMLSPVGVSQKITAPVNLRLSRATYNSILLTWEPVNGEGVTYDIYREGEKVNTVPVTTTAYQDTGLSIGTAYSYYVVAVKNKFESQSSAELLVETKTPEINFTVEGLDNVREGAVDFSVQVSIEDNGAISPSSNLKYKIEVTRYNQPLENLEIKYPDEGDDPNDPNTWHSFVTDGRGEAYFGPAAGFTPAELLTTGITTPFQTLLEKGSYKVVISLLDISTGEEVVLGNGGKGFEAIPVLQPGQICIVLDWGETPYDLDSHLQGVSLEDNEELFHVYYDNKIYNDGEISLGNDVTDSYGPETIYVIQLHDNILYKYWVKDYTNGGSSTSKELSNSNAMVRVYNSDGYENIQVPANVTGYIWNVLTINGSTLDVINSFPPPELQDVSLLDFNNNQSFGTTDKIYLEFSWEPAAGSKDHIVADLSSNAILGDNAQFAWTENILEITLGENAGIGLGDSLEINKYCVFVQNDVTLSENMVIQLPLYFEPLIYLNLYDYDGILNTGEFNKHPEKDIMIPLGYAEPTGMYWL